MVMLEAPDRVNELILNFLNRDNATRSVIQSMSAITLESHDPSHNQSRDDLSYDESLDQLPDEQVTSPKIKLTGATSSSSHRSSQRPADVPPLNLGNDDDDEVHGLSPRKHWPSALAARVRPMSSMRGPTLTRRSTSRISLRGGNQSPTKGGGD